MFCDMSTETFNSRNLLCRLWQFSIPVTHACMYTISVYTLSMTKMSYAKCNSYWLLDVLMFTVSHISYEHTVHHSSKEQCIEVLPWGTYIVPCIPSCNHSAVVLEKLVSLQEELSNIFSNRHFHSCFTPILLEMEAPESRSSSVPNSGLLGKQPALCAGEVLLVSEEDRQ